MRQQKISFWTTAKHKIFNNTGMSPSRESTKDVWGRDSGRLQLPRKKEIKIKVSVS